MRGDVQAAIGCETGEDCLEGVSTDRTGEIRRTSSNDSVSVPPRVEK